MSALTVDLSGKGGSLIRLTEDAQAVYREAGTKSPAYYAFGFVKELEGVEMVLSGMSELSQVRENCALFSAGTVLTQAERRAIDQVCRIYQAKDLIPCTGCGYCTETCPAAVPIPFIFACLNKKKTFKNWNQDYYYRFAVTSEGRASSCIRCGRCEARCPQHLPVRQLLEEAARVFRE